VARILGARGLSGAMKVETLSDLPERTEVGAELWIEGEAAPRRVTLAQTGGRVPVIGLEGIETREQAEALVGRYLQVETRALPEGTYYWHQLEGLRVVDERGEPLGHLVEVFRAGENEVYRVAGPGGELLIPALRQVVHQIDLDAGTMVVSRPDSEEVR
jgi:16S rRNA processing protein RimM